MSRPGRDIGNGATGRLNYIQDMRVVNRNHGQDHRQGRVGAHPAFLRHPPENPGRAGVLFWAPPEKPGRAGVLFWAPPEKPGRAGVLFWASPRARAGPGAR
jgi:hypothetical protein